MENSNATNPPGKVPYDPGWNDPPNIAYNVQQVPTPNRPRLNKRVAFPLSGGSPAPQPPVNLPAMPAAIPTLPPQTPKTIPSEDEVNINSEHTLSEVKSILLDLLENNSELGPKSNEIKRRLGVMEEMWVNDKLNKRIHVQMKDLANALKEDEPKRADDIHRALMVNHVSAVGTWMPGVKQLIHHCIARSELLSIDKE